MKTDLRQAFVDLFGEDAPAIPQTREEFQRLNITQQQRVAQALPAFHQSLVGNPNSLPAAVSLRRERGELLPGDVAALRAAGLSAEALQLEQTSFANQVASFEKQAEDERAAREASAEYRAAENERARQQSFAHGMAALGHAVQY